MTQYNYEVEAIVEDDGDCHIAQPGEAVSFYSAYQRPLGKTPQLAEWLADFRFKHDAELFVAAARQRDARLSKRIYSRAWVHAALRAELERL